MNKNSHPSAKLLTVEDQLTLLKDSIDLRFTHKEDNEFAQLSKADLRGQFEINEKIQLAPSMLAIGLAGESMRLSTNEILPQHDYLKEQLKNKRSIRYICCMVIWMSLFTPFLNIGSGSDALLGHNLISALLGLFKHPSATNGQVIFVAIYPLLLILYASTLALFPNNLNFKKARMWLWSLSAGSGIFYFFAALTLFTAGGLGNQGLSTIGFGYYLSMVAIFAYHFLNQLIEPNTAN
ncbi:MAG: hypothetical protein AB8G95_15485 [Anaerolineae bacterium]